jgi:hypothetical protein
LRTFGTSEFSIFEHVLLYKFWYKLCEQAYRRKLHEDLYRDLLEKQQVHLIHNQTLENSVNKKLREKTKIKDQLNQIKYQSFFFKEVFGLKDPAKLNQENLDYNV